MSIGILSSQLASPRIAPERRQCSVNSACLACGEDSNHASAEPASGQVLTQQTILVRNGRIVDHAGIRVVTFDQVLNDDDALEACLGALDAGTPAGTRLWLADGGKAPTMHIAGTTVVAMSLVAIVLISLSWFGAKQAFLDMAHITAINASQLTAERTRRIIAPGEAMLQADAALADARAALDTRFSHNEPRAKADHGIPRLDARKYQGKHWATRARPWVDRLASAWLIRRFIDPQAQFVWLQDVASVPRGALGFDFDGARFTHVGTRVTFEVLLASFGLEQDARLSRLGAVVHYLDAGGIPAPEAGGLEAVLAGLRALHADDNTLLDAACTVFDALFANPGSPSPPTRP